MRDDQRGVTLIELLVGLAIFSIAAGVVVMTAPPRRPPARDAAEAFAARLALSFDEVIFTGAARRLEWTEAGYRFLHATADGWQVETEWTPRRTGIVFAMDREGGAAENALALNGGDVEGTLVGFGGGFSSADAPKDETDEAREIFPIDPLGAGEILVARFESSNGAWRVELAPTGEVSVVRE